MKLVICEKPSVAKAVASALGVTSRADGCFEGNGLIVSWCVGHLVSPMDAAGYDPGYKKWKYDDLPILPEPFRYVLAKDKEDAFQNLKRLMDREDVTELVNACDAGREGELIFRLVYEMAGCRKPFSRLWISSMEDAAIREGFADLRPGAEYDPLYQSALCRQKADWLIGINATRLFSVLYHRTLNVGRVQTPTLAMLVDRDSKITMFRKEKYHHVRLTLGGAEAVSERITSPEEAETLLNSLFLAGGLMLSQVASLTGLEPYVIQNWVRRGFVAPPERKRYSRRQFSRIVLINMLKDSMQLDKICALLSYVNGELDDESDDLIDDFQLYLYIVRLAALVEHQPPSGPDEAARWCQTAAESYRESVPGARDRVARCLHVILTAYLAGRLKQEAEALLAALA